MNSMTGFGRGEFSQGFWNCEVELSSVNRKQLDLAVFVPREFGSLEPLIRTYLSSRFSRGRLTAKVKLAPSSEAGFNRVSLNEGLAKLYAGHYQKLQKTLEGVPLAPLDLTRVPGVFEVSEPEVETEELWPVVEGALAVAVGRLREMRDEEGRHLKQVILQGLTNAQRLVAELRARSPEVIAHYRKALRKRLADANLALPLEDERLIKEVALFADRSDVSEELDRLDSHFGQFRRYVDSTEPVGRSLDFLSQEMNREFNTVGSKANDASLAQLVVEGKAEIERIREQVQNVE